MATHPYRTRSYIQQPRNLQTHNPSFDRSLSALEWSSTPSNFYAHEDLYDDYLRGRPSQKKSIFARAKEKAKKWRQSLLRTNRTEHEEPNSTPPWGVSLNDDEEEYDTELIHGTSKMGVYAFEDSDSEKNSTIHYPILCNAAVSPAPAPALKNAEREAEMKQSNDGVVVLGPESIKLAPVADSATKVAPAPDTTTTATTTDASPSIAAASPCSSKSLSETVAETLAPAYATVAGTLAPAYAAVAGATMAISSKIQVSAGKQMVWEKSASMKEYLMQKLAEPKELGEVITEAATPRADGAHGALEYEDNEEAAASSSSPVASTASSSSASASASALAKEEDVEPSPGTERAESPISVSTNTHQGGDNESSRGTSREYTNY